ncbi:MAG: outer membrane lipid asymmetry maintenance protein MlaD [Rhodobacteraceae bacterium]|nr:outer membrane lipid asymmetry maintenance protein MlaD [Paracoccaceae bacterium]
MINSAAETVIGGVVIAAAVLFLAYAANTAGVATQTDGYKVTASFRSAEGIAPGTDVRIAGVKVGSVIGLDLDKETFRAVTTLRLAEGVDIPDDSMVVISPEGILGGSFVELVPGGSPFNVEPGGEILDTQGSVSLISLLLKFVSGPDE